jgi:3-methyladenine DNA glycosylase Mpg
LCVEDGLYLEQGETAPRDPSPRINIDYAGEAAAWLYRFTMRGSGYVSR